MRALSPRAIACACSASLALLLAIHSQTRKTNSNGTELTRTIETKSITECAPLNHTGFNQTLLGQSSHPCSLVTLILRARSVASHGTTCELARNQLAVAVALQARCGRAHRVSLLFRRVSVSDRLCGRTTVPLLATRARCVHPIGTQWGSSPLLPPPLQRLPAPSSALCVTRAWIVIALHTARHAHLTAAPLSMHATDSAPL